MNEIYYKDDFENYPYPTTFRNENVIKIFSQDLSNENLDEFKKLSGMKISGAYHFASRIAKVYCLTPMSLKNHPDRITPNLEQVTFWLDKTIELISNDKSYFNNNHKNQHEDCQAVVLSIINLCIIKSTDINIISWNEWTLYAWSLIKNNKYYNTEKNSGDKLANKAALLGAILLLCGDKPNVNSLKTDKEICLAREIINEYDEKIEDLFLFSSNEGDPLAMIAFGILRGQRFHFNEYLNKKICQGLQNLFYEFLPKEKLTNFSIRFELPEILLWCYIDKLNNLAKKSDAPWMLTASALFSAAIKVNTSLSEGQSQPNEINSIDNKAYKLHIDGVKDNLNEGLLLLLKEPRELKDLIASYLSFKIEFDKNNDYLNECNQIISELEKGFNQNMYYDSYFKDALIAEAKHELERARLLHAQLNEAKRHSQMIEDLMAGAAHQFGGAVSSLITNAKHYHDERVYLSTARTLSGLLDLFSIVSVRSEELQKKLRSDHEGEGRMDSVLANSIILALLHLLSSKNRSKLNRYLYRYAVAHAMVEHEELTKSWSKDSGHIKIRDKLADSWEDDVSQLMGVNSLDSVCEWVGGHLMPIKVSGLSHCDIRFSRYEITESLLTTVFPELLINAIKHSDENLNNSIYIQLATNEKTISLQCINSSTERSRINNTGSGRGLEYLRLLSEKAGGKFISAVDQDNSVAIFTFVR